MRVGVDVGGTSIRARLFGDDSGPRVEAATSAVGGEALVDRIAETVEILLSESGYPPPEGVGVGVPGIVNPVAGTVRHAVNLGVDGHPFPLGPLLTSRLGLPVVIENDVRAAALGVFHHLRSRGDQIADLVLLSVGTGISAGVIIDGRLHRGRHGLAGEIGHAPLADGDRPCPCGLVGCLESVASGRAISEATGHAAEELFGDNSPHPGTASVAAALARAMRVLATAYDPDILVLGGGIGPHAAPAVRAALRRDVSPFGEVVLTPDRIVTLPPDADVGTTGAALLVPTTAISGTPENRQGGNRP